MWATMRLLPSIITVYIRRTTGLSPLHGCVCNVHWMYAKKPTAHRYIRRGILLKGNLIVIFEIDVAILTTTGGVLSVRSARVVRGGGTSPAARSDATSRTRGRPLTATGTGHCYGTRVADRSTVTLNLYLCYVQILFIIGKLR